MLNLEFKSKNYSYKYKDDTAKNTTWNAKKNS